MTRYAPSMTAAVADGPGLRWTSAEVTLDESWSPFVQGRLTIPMPDAATYAALDPRNDARVRMLWRQSFVASERVSALTAEHGGGQLSALTAAYAGSRASSVSSDYGTPLNAFGMRGGSSRRFDLAVRGRIPNFRDRTLTIELQGDEMLLQDFALVDTAPYFPNTTSVRQIVVGVLSRIGATLSPGTDDGTIDPAASAWNPGVSGWDYVAPLVQKAGLRLWCDERRNWRLTTDAVTVPRVLALSNARNLTDGSASTSRDADEWCDAVVVKYSWTDAAGAQQTRYDVASTAGYSKVQTVEYDNTPYPGPGAAARILARALNKGQTLDLTALSDYTAEPGVSFIAELATGDQAGAISSVSWRLPDNVMRIGTRGVTDVSPAAWDFLPAGNRWIDSPAGQTWTNEVIA